MPNHFIVNNRDLTQGNPTNPSGIWSVAYLGLKRALDNNDAPDNVLQALYDWLGQRKISPQHVDKILELPSAEHAYEALVSLIGGKLNAKLLPAQVKQTLQRAIQRIAEKNVARGEQELAQSRERLNTMRSRFSVESAPQIVRRLVAS